LQLNWGDGTFVDIAPFAGLAATEWNWVCAFLDVDLDGFEDLLCTTGHMFDTQDLDAEGLIRSKGPWTRETTPQKLLLFPRMTQPKQAFRNRGNLTFEDAAMAWGFNQVGVSQGMAFGDLDNDGDLDVVVNNLNDAAGIYRNDTSAPRIAVRLKGLSPNTHGIGAKVSLVAEVSGDTSEKPFLQRQEICAGGRYLSSDEPLRVFAADLTEARRTQLGATTPPVALRLEVEWRSGKRTVLKNVLANHVYEMHEGTSREEGHTPSQSVAVTNLFEDVSNRIRHKHYENVFNDFDRQPLLPRKLSQAGPGIAWFDYDVDGHDDLLIGSGRNGQMAVYRNDGLGQFTTVAHAALAAAVPLDQSSVVGVCLSPDEKRTQVLAGASNYETGQSSVPVLTVYDLNAGTSMNSFPGQQSSSGPLALADVDSDGDLELFVGGRCIAGKWPTPATSLVFQNRDGRFVLNASATVAFANIGLVSGATFADLNADGLPDLVIACEWSPIRIFINENGRLNERTTELGLNPYVGWWNGVAVGDFDSDGRLDIAASNWGLNGSTDGYARPTLTVSPGSAPGVPLLFWGDFGGGTEGDLVEADYDQECAKVMPIRSKPATATALPWISEKFSTFAAFNSASVPELLGERYPSASSLSAPWLASTVFLNRGGKFEPVVLPPAAQFSPAFGISVADFDGNGTEDLFLAQNFFGVQPEAVRCDAARSVLLLGDGQGGFEAAPASVSGLLIYGEGRAAAVCDFDKDGRPDLAVGQNGAETRLYHNLGAKPGLRVRLIGSATNPYCIGAEMRLQFGQRLGPVRQVSAGSGYWSQDSPVQVLSTPESPTGIWIRWPGGGTNLVAVKPGAREIAITRSSLKK
jgi:hypothetical protein